MVVHVLIFIRGDIRESQEVDIQSGILLLEDKIMQEILFEDVETL